MAIQERYTALRTSGKIGQEEGREEAERPEELRKQSVLLRGLKELGVIGMLEELTGERVEIAQNLTDGIEMVSIERPWEVEMENDVKTTATLENFYRKWQDMETWSIEITSPCLSDSGVWNSNLDIILRKIDVDEWFPWRFHAGPTVILTYTLERRLIIAGQEIVFVGELPIDSEKRFEIVENAVARAMLNPQGK